MHKQTKLTLAVYFRTMHQHIELAVKQTTRGDATHITLDEEDDEKWEMAWELGLLLK